jgi:hypothetical protein
MIEIPAAVLAAMVVKLQRIWRAGRGWREAGGWPDEAIRTPSHPMCRLPTGPCKVFRQPNPTPRTTIVF